MQCDWYPYEKGNPGCRNPPPPPHRRACHQVASAWTTSGTLKVVESRQILKSESPRSKFWLFLCPVTLGTQYGQRRDMVLSQGGSEDELGLYVNQAALGGHCVRGSCNCNWASCDFHLKMLLSLWGPYFSLLMDLKKIIYIYVEYLFISFVCAMQDPSFPTRDRTHAPYIGNAAS